MCTGNAGPQQSLVFFLVTEHVISKQKVNYILDSLKLYILDSLKLYILGSES